MARFPMPTADQLRQLKHAAEQNAEDLTADARALLDVGRFPRAYALAVLALEELGKAQLCHDVLAGDLDETSFRREWSTHVPKLDRISILTILAAKTEERIFAACEDDHTMKLRGLYVEPNQEHPGGPPQTPSEVSQAQATEMVEIAEEVTLGAASHDWVIPYG